MKVQQSLSLARNRSIGRNDSRHSRWQDHFRTALGLEGLEDRWLLACTGVLSCELGNSLAAYVYSQASDGNRVVANALDLFDVSHGESDDAFRGIGPPTEGPFEPPPAASENAPSSFEMIAFSPEEQVINEDESEPVYYLISRSGDTDQRVTVQLRFSGTATIGSDYQLGGVASFGSGIGKVVFKPGQLTRQITIYPQDDDVIEELREFVTLELIATGDYEVGAVAGATLGILDREPVDFGDAPVGGGDPLYRIARHIPVGPTLGTRRDAELDWYTSELADADDLEGEADEDGITFAAAYYPGQLQASLTVHVSNAPRGARLDMAVDFDGDGSWASANERIVINRLVGNGVHLVTFDIPVDARAAKNYLRARLSTEGGSGDWGLALDGEIEDHMFPLMAGLGTGHFSPVAEYAGGVLLREPPTVGDMDGDGDPDVVFQEYSNDTISWLEMDGLRPTGNVHLIASGYSREHLRTVDFDGDGDTDVLSFGPNSGRVEWHENTTGAIFATHEIAVAGDAFGRDIHAVEIGDLDNDGDLDLVASFEAEGIVLLVNDGRMQFTPGNPLPFTAASLALFDLERDGDLDAQFLTLDGRRMLITDNVGGAATLLINRELRVNALESPVAHVLAADLDNDGDMDFASACGELHRSQVFGCEPPRASVNWHEQTDDGIVVNHSVVSDYHASEGFSVVDIDGDGDLDLVGADMFSGALHVYDNDGAGGLSPRTLATAYPGEYRRTVAIPADFDNDGDIDVLWAANEYQSWQWFTNIDSSVSVALSSDRIVEGTDAETNIEVRRRGNLSRPLSVNLEVGGTTRVGEDYQLGGEFPVTEGRFRVFFDAGQDFVLVPWRVIDDLEVELEEEFTVTIDGDTSEYVVAPGGPRDSLIVSDNESVDFGDAPWPYPTTIEQRGPMHGAGGPSLGALRDAELNGLPDELAEGDDRLGGNDEDGVVFGTLRRGELGIAYVDVQNVDSQAFIDAWIDFDGDGTWSGYQEHVLVNVPVASGNHNLTFRIPVDAHIGTSFARVRVSSFGKHGIIGPAQDGEVEDHLVVIAAESPSAEVFGPGKLIEGIAESSIDRIDAVDMDQDGDQDLVLLNDEQILLAWYANEGGGRFGERHEFDHLIGGRDFRFVDFDADGDIDVVNKELRDLLSWIETGGPESNYYHALVRDSTGQGIAEYDLVDFDLDGDLDVFVGNSSKMQWFVNEGDFPFPLHHAVDLPSVNQQSQLDVDGDGDLDYISRWSRYVMIEDSGTGSVTAYGIPSSFFRTYPVKVTDIDTDGDLDVLTDQGIWLENTAEHHFEVHDVDPDSQLLREQLLVDFNGDGHWDVVSGGGELVAYGAGTGDFDVRSYGLSAELGIGVIAMDVDGDRDLDLVSHNGRQVMWFEQVANAISLSVPDITAKSEGDAPVDLVLRRTGPTDQPRAVPFAFSGTAEYGEDYVIQGMEQSPDGGYVAAFSVGQDALTLTLHVLDDQDLESRETVVIDVLNGKDFAVDASGHWELGMIDNEHTDYGDAPRPYPTDVYQNGARHGAVGPTLGATRDEEGDGIPSAAADSDGSDDDGVRFGPLVIGQKAEITVEVRNMVPPLPRLYGWIDFNGDGTWSQADEHVVDRRFLQEGFTTLSFEIPPTARPGVTYARFRLAQHSGTDGLAPTGVVSNGEVEDYAIVLEHGSVRTELASDVTASLTSLSAPR
ncbi:MAG: VCBS repeat-containing protein, partial [Planctomycetales bacterium]|nr:VCBS repeat-containing protein [Planctomycetales bacterium]